MGSSPLDMMSIYMNYPVTDIIGLRVEHKRGLVVYGIDNDRDTVETIIENAPSSGGAKAKLLTKLTLDPSTVKWSKSRYLRTPGERCELQWKMRIDEEIGWPYPATRAIAVQRELSMWELPEITD